MSFIRFRCLDDYLKFFDIDFWLHFLYRENGEPSTLIREDERMFYNNLKEIKKFVDYFKKMKIDFNNKSIIYSYFVQIKTFIREYNDGFKHKNEKIERKFNKVAKDLEKLFDYR